jgi:hypothetical protein
MGQRLAGVGRAAVGAVLELVKPKFAEIDARLDEQDGNITQIGSRLSAIEADPTPPDELTRELVRTEQPAWAKLLK